MIFTARIKSACAVLGILLDSSACSRGHVIASSVDDVIVCPAPPVSVSAKSEAVVRKSDPETMAIAIAAVDRPLLEARFPSTAGWQVGARRFYLPPASTLHLAVAESRRDDVVLARRSFRPAANQIDIVLAFRVKIAAMASDGVEGEISLGEIAGSQVLLTTWEVHSQCAIPSAHAVRDGWLDDTWIGGEGGHLNGRACETSVVAVISWNGRYSSAFAQIRDPDLNVHGSMMVLLLDDDTRRRTQLSLPDWPEPVWYLAASFKSGV